MFKQIPGNHNWSISLSGEIKNVDGTACTPEVRDNLVYIEMYGQMKWLDRQWLMLIAHFEVNLPKENQSSIWSIKFINANPKSKTVSGFIMRFNRPIIYAKRYRIIPGYTDYAVSEDGDVVNTIDGVSVKIPDRGLDSYLLVDIYNPDKCQFMSTAVHRLVAFAWVSNDDPFLRYIVNHKDGVKTNPRARNLEWVTFSENSNHAFENGLRTDNLECRVRNIEDGSITEFVSMGRACAFMGFPATRPRESLFYKTKSKLIAGKYEFKLKSDTSPWFYENRELGEKAGRYSLSITYSDGRKEVHPDIRTFKKKFGVWNVSNVYDLKEKAEKMYPDIVISIEDHYAAAPVQALNVETGEIINADGVRKLSQLIGRPRDSIRNCLKANETRVSQGFAYRYKSDSEWNRNFTAYKSSSRCILATHSDTDEVLEFPSLTQAARHFGVDRQVIKRCAQRRIRFGEWDIRETDL